MAFSYTRALLSILKIRKEYLKTLVWCNKVSCLQVGNQQESSCQAMNSLWLLSDHADTDSSFYLHFSLSQPGRPKNKSSLLFLIFLILAYKGSIIRLLLTFNFLFSNSNSLICLNEGKYCFLLHFLCYYKHFCDPFSTKASLCSNGRGRPPPLWQNPVIIH